MDLRYGINPQQQIGRCRTGAARPVAGPGAARQPVLHQHARRADGWQLVSEASQALNRPSAASFKHVSPAGAAVAGPVDEVTAELNGVDRAGVGALTSAYLRARDADPSPPTATSSPSHTRSMPNSPS